MNRQGRRDMYTTVSIAVTKLFEGCKSGFEIFYFLSQQMSSRCLFNFLIFKPFIDNFFKHLFTIFHSLLIADTLVIINALNFIAHRLNFFADYSIRSCPFEFPSRFNSIRFEFFNDLISHFSN